MFFARPIGGLKESCAHRATGFFRKLSVSQPSASIVSPARSTDPSEKTNRSVLASPATSWGSLVARHITAPSGRALPLAEARKSSMVRSFVMEISELAFGASGRLGAARRIRGSGIAAAALCRQAGGVAAGTGFRSSRRDKPDGRDIDRLVEHVPTLDIRQPFGPARFVRRVDHSDDARAQGIEPGLHRSPEEAGDVELDEDAFLGQAELLRDLVFDPLE